MIKSWYSVSMEICHFHQLKNDDASLNLRSGYGTKTARAHVRVCRHDHPIRCKLDIIKYDKLQVGRFK